MNHYLQLTKTFIVKHKTDFIIGVGFVAGSVFIVTMLILSARQTTPQIVYKPVTACSLLNPSEARELLGESTLKSNETKPEQNLNTSTSKCGYTDGATNRDSMTVAAIMVRAGINDEGVQQNKKEFVDGKPKENIETVKDLGDDAYYNQENGQLNVLKGRNWIIVSLGIGSAPELNTIEQAVTLAKKVV